MEITGLNKYSHTYAASKNVGAKYNGGEEINMAEIFRKEVLNWEEKIKKKINEDLENDREGNNNMSEKNWNAFINKVDRAMNAFTDYSRLNMESKRQILAAGSEKNHASESEACTQLRSDK